MIDGAASAITNIYNTFRQRLMVQPRMNDGAAPPVARIRAMNDDARSPVSRIPGETGALAGFAFYNVGRQNAEVYAKKWKQTLERLTDDVGKCFCQEDTPIHVLCISEFGSMMKSIDEKLMEGAVGKKGHGVTSPDGSARRVKCQDTKTLFQEIVQHLGLMTIEVVAHPPYVALVDTWR